MWCRLVRDNSIQIFHDVVLFEGLTYILKWEVVGEDKIFFFFFYAFSSASCLSRPIWETQKHAPDGAAMQMVVGVPTAPFLCLLSFVYMSSNISVILILTHHLILALL